MSDISISADYGSVYKGLLSNLSAGSAVQGASDTSFAQLLESTAASDELKAAAQLISAGLGSSADPEDIVSGLTSGSLEGLDVLEGLDPADIGLGSQLTGEDGLLGSMSGQQLSSLMLSMASMGGLSGSEGGEMAILQSLMYYTLMSKLSASASATAAPSDSSAGTTAEELEPVTSQESVSSFDSGAFSNQSGTEGAGGSAEIPAAAWVAVNPAVRSTESGRSPELLKRVIAQFDVENNVRYRPHKYGNDTYCNIFVWDVTTALGAEIPHYVNEAGTPQAYPFVQNATELDANGVCQWLEDHGSSYGWVEVDARQAQQYANMGRPAVSTWNNRGGVGHVQMVCPSESGEYDEALGVSVAQAGARNTEYSYLVNTMPAAAISQVKYYVHR